MYELKLIADGMSNLMTVKQVAEALGVAPVTINQNVAKLFPGLAVNGVATYLDEVQVTAIKMAIERSGRNDLMNIRKVPEATTELEMMMLDAKVSEWKNRRIAELSKEVDALRISNAELEPKAAFFDQVADSKTALQMRDVAAALNLPGWGRNKIFLYLRNNGILDEKNIPYREFQDRGYFRVVERTWTDAKGDTHISLTTLVYQRGIDYIRKMIARG